MAFSDIGAGGLINPNKTYAEVDSESAVGHELYRKSHNTFNVSEPLRRNYTSTEFSHNSKFGKRKAESKEILYTQKRFH